MAALALLLSSDVRTIAYRQTYLQFNLCGNACSGGGLPVVDDVAAAVHRREPFAATLNEMCENQYDALRHRLPGYQSRFDATGATCHNGERYGNAVFLRAPSMSLVGSWALPKPAGDETRRLLCVRPGGEPRPVVCVTHISNVSGNVAAQISAVAAVLSGLHDPTVLGGDFNTVPGDPRLAPLYHAFTEADAGHDQPTYGRSKFDYVFLSRGAWSSPRVETGHPDSDHEALWATTTFGAPTP